MATEAAESGEAWRLGVRLTSGPQREMQLEFGRRHTGPDRSENALKLKSLIRWSPPPGPLR